MRTIQKKDLDSLQIVIPPDSELGDIERETNEIRQLYDESDDLRKRAENLRLERWRNDSSVPE